MRVLEPGSLCGRPLSADEPDRQGGKYIESGNPRAGEGERDHRSQRKRIFARRPRQQE